MSLQYFSVDCAGAPRWPPNIPALSAKCFGISPLEPRQKMKDAKGIMIEVDEREEFLSRLWEKTFNFTKPAAFSISVCVYVFGISTKTWLAFEGKVRFALMAADHKLTTSATPQGESEYKLSSRSSQAVLDTAIPKVTPPGKSVFSLSPRSKQAALAMKIIKNCVEKNRELSWLCAEAFHVQGTQRNNWYEAMWKHVFTEQSKIVADHSFDIKKNAKGRADQVVTFDFSRASIGEYLLVRNRNEAREITGFELCENKDKSMVRLPKSWRRPPLKQLSIRVVPVYRHLVEGELDYLLDEAEDTESSGETEDDVRQESGPKGKRAFDKDFNDLDAFAQGESEDSEAENFELLEGEAWEVLYWHDPLPDVQAVSITYAKLDKISAPYRAGARTSGVLEKLQHALEKDLNVLFKDDHLVLAWHNPMDFWGRQHNYCRLRSSAELEKVLETLRTQHLVEESDEQVLFLYLCTEWQVKTETAHPPWPAEYEMEFEVNARKRVKRKVDSMNEAETDSPRKRVRRA